MSGPDSHGFCLLNNISIAGAYALNKHREVIKRIAIVDFDVHHGNGTEETIRWLTPHLSETVQEDAEGSSFSHRFVPQYKPWLGEGDQQNVMFVSVHGYGPREKGMEHLMPMAAFYPGSGQTHIISTSTSTSISGRNKVEKEVEKEIEKVVEKEVEVEEEEEGSDVYLGGNRKLEELFKMFSSSRSALPSSAAAGPYRAAVKPLILDIGVSLPAGDAMEESAADKLISELSYRTFEFVLHFVGCVTVTVSPNQIIIIIIINNHLAQKKILLKYI